MAKFGITQRKLGVTAHGLRHEALIDEFVAQTGQQPPVRGGVEVPAAAEQLAVSRLAGHARKRASSAYLGSSAVMRSNPSERSDPPAEPNGSHCP